MGGYIADPDARSAEQNQTAKDYAGYYNKVYGAGTADDNTYFNTAEHLRNDSYADLKNRAGQIDTVNNKKQEMINLQQETGREDFNNSLQKNRENASSRGLLYSGIKEGADYDSARAQAGNEASYQQQVNEAADTELGDLDKNFANTSLQNYENRISQSQNAYQQALQRRQGNSAGSIGQAIGSIGGALLPF